MKSPSIFLMEKMPWEKQYTIRLHFPGMDDGSAFQLESEAGESKEHAEELLSKVAQAIGVKIETL